MLTRSRRIGFVTAVALGVAIQGSPVWGLTSAGDIVLASRADDGTKGNELSGFASLSGDGTKVAFTSFATNLDPADTDGVVDVYVKDLVTGNLTLASTTVGGTKGNASSFSASVSADGTKVAFTSVATNLDPADTDGLSDVYVKDLVTGNLILVSATTAGTKGNGESVFPALSADGTKVAFESFATNLDPADPDGLFDVYVKDLVTGNLILVSVTAAGTKGNSHSGHPSLSADGRKVAFDSFATNLDPADPDSLSDVYVKDLATGNLALASATAAGTKGNGDSRLPSLSAAGNRVAFVSHATNLDPADTDGLSDVYVKDLATGNLALASATAAGIDANANSVEASLSSDGTRVAFESFASNLDPADSVLDSDIYVKDLMTGGITLASTTDDGTKGNSDSDFPSLSADGTKVAFDSSATNLDLPTPTASSMST